MSQELFVSVSQLIELANAKGQTYDHIVIESSGISEPKSVRTVFQDAEAYGVALMNEVRVTVAKRFGVACPSGGAFRAKAGSCERQFLDR